MLTVDVVKADMRLNLSLLENDSFVLIFFTYTRRRHSESAEMIIYYLFGQKQRKQTHRSHQWRHIITTTRCQNKLITHTFLERKLCRSTQTENHHFQTFASLQEPKVTCNYCHWFGLCFQSFQLLQCDSILICELLILTALHKVVSECWSGVSSAMGSVYNCLRMHQNMLYPDRLYVAWRQ